MNKTVRVSGLQAVLDKLAPFVKAIAGGTVQLAEGITLNVPDESTLEFSATRTPDVIRLEFNGLTADIDTHAFFGLIPVHGREPVTFADVGPSSIQTRVSICTITAVDGGGGS